MTESNMTTIELLEDLNKKYMELPLGDEDKAYSTVAEQICMVVENKDPKNIVYGHKDDNFWQWNMGKIDLGTIHIYFLGSFLVFLIFGCVIKEMFVWSVLIGVIAIIILPLLEIKRRRFEGLRSVYQTIKTSRMAIARRQKQEQFYENLKALEVADNGDEKNKDSVFVIERAVRTIEKHIEDLAGMRSIFEQYELKKSADETNIAIGELKNTIDELQQYSKNEEDAWVKYENTLAELSLEASDLRVDKRILEAELLELKTSLNK